MKSAAADAAARRLTGEYLARTANAAHRGRGCNLNCASGDAVPGVERAGNFGMELG